MEEINIKEHEIVGLFPRTEYSEDVKFRIRTDGKGLYTPVVKNLDMIGWSFSIWEDDGRNSGLFLYFNIDNWDIYKEGIIYTDKTALQMARQFFMDRFKLKKEHVESIIWSESGMQGEDFLHFDISVNFTTEILKRRNK
jgi:hypothetical protein